MDTVSQARGLAYVGQITSLEVIENASFIFGARVSCGNGVVWRGVVRKDDFQEGDLCVVYLQDAVIPPNEEMKFMEKHKWRVKMMRFRGAPSEVVIMPLREEREIGEDLTQLFGISEYFKPVPANLQGKSLGPFPAFIPKTDEPKYQSVPEMIEQLCDNPYYISVKMDGSSTTAYKYQGKFGVCSRNWELEPDPEIGYWQIAKDYDLEEKLPEGIALQWETCGPKIQGNPVGLRKIEGFAFSAYDIKKQKYLEMVDLIYLCTDLKFPLARIEGMGLKFDKEKVDLLGEGIYDNGKQREGVVVRSQVNFLGHKPISFKVINLNYES